MIHAISIIVGYVGGDLSTPFARKHVGNMEKILVENPDGPICLLMERKELYMSSNFSHHLFRNGYFTEELLERMDSYIPWEHAFSCEYIPYEFVMKRMDKCKGVWNYPRLPLSMLKEKMKTTKFSVVCKDILGNPALFSEGAEKAKDVVDIAERRGIVSFIAIKFILSSNRGALLEFFIQNPEYIFWDFLVNNHGAVFRGEEGKVVSFLTGAIEKMGVRNHEVIVRNPAVPLKFLEDNIINLIARSHMEVIEALSCNTSITLQWWDENMKGYDPVDYMDELSRRPSTSWYDVIAAEMSTSDSYSQQSYNVPVEDVIEICEGNLGSVDWRHIALNRGFCLQLSL